MSLPRLRRLALCVLSASILVSAGCGGDDSSASDEVGAGDEAAASNGEGAAEEGAGSGYVEPDYDGLPADLTSEEVCALLDEATVTEHLGSEVTKVTPGTRQPDCQWFYKLEGGPATNLQVQVMSMDQTGDRLGTEALEWGLDRAPADVEVVEVPTLDVPSGSYEFGSSTVYFVVDPVGRIFTVSAHNDSPEAGRLALVEEVLAGLTANHS